MQWPQAPGQSQPPAEPRLPDCASQSCPISPTAYSNSHQLHPLAFPDPPRPPQAACLFQRCWLMVPPNVAASDLPPRAPLHSLSHAPLGKSDSSLRCSCEFLRFPKSARRVMTAGVGRGKEPVLSSPPPSSPHPGPGKMAMLSLSPSVTGAQGQFLHQKQKTRGGHGTQVGCDPSMKLVSLGTDEHEDALSSNQALRQSSHWAVTAARAPMPCDGKGASSQWPFPQIHIHVAILRKYQTYLS